MILLIIYNINKWKKRNNFDVPFLKEIIFICVFKVFSEVVMVNQDKYERCFLYVL